MNAELTRLSKFLSFVLRHRPEKIGLVLDDQGWTAVDNLIHQAKNYDEFLSAAQIHEIVKDNDKQRFHLSEDGARIRAVQGHSTAAVTIKRQAQRPPAVLFHGTADRFQASIEKQGILPGKRH
jgi:putative RNA 2'-phosphotransferase